MLEKKGRLVLDMPCFEWIDRSLKLTYLNVLPVTPSIAVESCHLPGAFHGDPADQMIIATARIEQKTLITRDVKILQYSRSKWLHTIQA